MNRKNALALLINAVLPGTEALQTKSRTFSHLSLSDVRNHRIAEATFNDYRKKKFATYEDQSDLTESPLQHYGEVEKIGDLEVFAADCADSVDAEDYKYRALAASSKARWFWTSLDEAAGKVEEQERMHAALRAKIPPQEDRQNDDWLDKRAGLDQVKGCNLVVRARMPADLELFQVTKKSLQAIVEDETLGKHLVKRWHHDPTGYQAFEIECTWANALRLAFGVSCGRSMYTYISRACSNGDIEDVLDLDCLNDYDLDEGAAADEAFDYKGWNNQFMPFAVHILKKSGASGMQIQYETKKPQVAIWTKRRSFVEREVKREVIVTKEGPN